MKKSYTPKASKPKQDKAFKASYSTGFKDRNLAAINPTKQQFEPTDAFPVNQHKQMAGC